MERRGKEVKGRKGKERKGREGKERKGKIRQDKTRRASERAIYDPSSWVMYGWLSLYVYKIAASESNRIESKGSTVDFRGMEVPQFICPSVRLSIFLSVQFQSVTFLSFPFLSSQLELAIHLSLGQY